jgi:hypothetical protein
VAIVREISKPRVKPPIYEGCHNSVLRLNQSDKFYKSDGLGEQQAKYLAKLNLEGKVLHEEKHAVDFIIESIEK